VGSAKRYPGLIGRRKGGKPNMSHTIIREGDLNYYVKFRVLEGGTKRERTKVLNYKKGGEKSAYP